MGNLTSLPHGGTAAWAPRILFHTCEVCTPGRSETMSFRETPTDRDRGREQLFGRAEFNSNPEVPSVNLT